MEFGDDFGDNTTTFHCQLSKGHKDEHMEEGILYRRRFRMTWGLGRKAK